MPTLRLFGWFLETLRGIPEDSKIALAVFGTDGKLSKLTLVPSPLPTKTKSGNGWKIMERTAISCGSESAEFSRMRPQINSFRTITLSQQEESI